MSLYSSFIRIFEPRFGHSGCSDASFSPLGAIIVSGEDDRDYLAASLDTESAGEKEEVKRYGCK